MIDAACARARAVESQHGPLRKKAATYRTERDVCRGNLQAAHLEVERLRARGERAPWILRWGLDVGVLVTAGGAGALLVADDVPDGLRWSAVTLAVGTLVGRLVVEVLD